MTKVSGEREPHSLSSPRLRLVPITASTIEALLNRDESKRRDEVPMQVPPGWPLEVAEDRRVLEARLEQLRARSGIEPWLIRALVDTEGRMVGHAGFHYPPATVGEALADPTYVGDRREAAGGLTELGYTIFPPDRGRGLATEAARRLVDWAFETMHVGGIIACTAPDNLPSIRVLEKIGGFRRIGFCLDENGGPEQVFRRDR